ncbi:Hypothetical_protein [Hexamita inflata]|uniref:Hypothetical_protein n=1 Tax=Hexamita inflata TaxID=28002 RepID=A0AA86VR66_9EUKA|nr:Hypothetical protein HINF_LOCUS61858 [Hexamita inflata]CAI9974218.1 Hypothetical protein HINF_LOCUS61863 [Hexamita inflata]
MIKLRLQVIQIKYLWRILLQQCSVKVRLKLLFFNNVKESNPLLATTDLNKASINQLIDLLLLVILINIGLNTQNQSKISLHKLQVIVDHLRTFLLAFYVRLPIFMEKKIHCYIQHYNAKQIQRIYSQQIIPKTKRNVLQEMLNDLKNIVSYYVNNSHLNFKIVPLSSDKLQFVIQHLFRVFPFNFFFALLNLINNIFLVYNPLQQSDPFVDCDFVLEAVQAFSSFYSNFLPQLFVFHQFNDFGSHCTMSPCGTATFVVRQSSLNFKSKATIGIPKAITSIRTIGNLSVLEVMTRTEAFLQKSAIFAWNRKKRTLQQSQPHYRNQLSQKQCFHQVQFIAPTPSKLVIILILKQILSIIINTATKVTYYSYLKFSQSKQQQIFQKCIC